MKLGIMQPYFFPYLGYWQLLNAVDTYVIYDDVAFSKRGWIHRNRILINGEVHYFNLSTDGSGSRALIKDVLLNSERKWIDKLLRTLERAYRKAPQYATVMPLVENILCCGKERMAELLEFQIREVAAYLNMETTILVSSRDVKKDMALRAQAKILDICQNLQATEYYNAIGGQELYDRDMFVRENIKLSFLQSETIVYRQFKNDFAPDLSLIDVLMFNSKDQVQSMLTRFRLL